MARPLGAVYTFGAILTTLWVLLPESGHPPRLVIALMAAGALVFGSLMLAGRLDWLRPIAFEAIVLLATLLIAIIVYLTGIRSGFAFGYLFATPYAFWFFPRWRALAQVAAAAICLLAALVLARAEHHSGVPMSDDYGSIALAIAAMLSVGELVHSLQAGLRERDARFARMFMRSPIGILRADREGRLLDVNPAFCDMVGRTESELLGRTADIFLAPDSNQDLVAEMNARVHHGGDHPTLILERECLRPDGKSRTVQLAVTAVAERDDGVAEMWGQALDITEGRRHEEQLQYLADHDPLTGLLNRRRFEQELARELMHVDPAARRGAVLSVDLDGFKAVNDSAGHEVGDEVLRRIAQQLDHALRGQDALARVGGDEFFALLRRAGCDEAARIAERVLRAVRELTIDVAGTPYQLSASIGVALFDDEPTLVGELMVSANLAMNDAKSSGRDRIAVFAADQAKTARNTARLSWGHRIRAALNEDRFELHWQPIVALASGRISHAELLLRMREDDNLISPGEFLGAAERLGLIHAIDRWVVKHAISLVASNRPSAGVPLSINLSGESVAGDPTLLELIETELNRTAIDPSMLIFEVTETASITSITEARRFADGVHALGCRLALDDFGSGFASFFYVKHLPIDYLKIDGEFVKDLSHSEVDRSLVSSMVQVGHALGVPTVAEMVEHKGTAQLLLNLGVDYAQGYHFGRPTAVPD
jgi:diguanylate cyclase (GGDEF)-like protein/PAS domain S-box-containing protein